MSANEVLLSYVLRLADNALVVGQRLVERVANIPELEEELANANFALDSIGQARMLYSYAAELDGKGHDEDYYAYHRDESEFRNVLLVEQPNGHFGDALVRQFLYESYYLHLLRALRQCADARLADIASRAEKEVAYHVRHNTQWLVRLGDGTSLSNERVQSSLNNLWKYTGELFEADDLDKNFQERYNGPDLEAILQLWREDVAAALTEATLTMPDEDQWMMHGGKQGRHSEHMGFLLAEMQYLQRSHAGAEW